MGDITVTQHPSGIPVTKVTAAINGVIVDDVAGNHHHHTPQTRRDGERRSGGEHGSGRNRYAHHFSTLSYFSNPGLARTGKGSTPPHTFDVIPVVSTPPQPFSTRPGWA